MRENIAGRRKSDIITRVLSEFLAEKQTGSFIKARAWAGFAEVALIVRQPRRILSQVCIFRSRGLRHSAKNYYRLFLKRSLKQISALIGVKL